MKSLWLEGGNYDVSPKIYNECILPIVAYADFLVESGPKIAQPQPARKMKLEFLENPSSTLLGYSRISNLFQVHFLDFLEIACWYWPDLARIQATKLGLSRISLNFK